MWKASVHHVLHNDFTHPLTTDQNVYFQIIRKFPCFIQDSTYHRDIFFLRIGFFRLLCFLHFCGLSTLTPLLFCLLFSCLCRHKLSLLRLMGENQTGQKSQQHVISFKIVIWNFSFKDNNQHIGRQKTEMCLILLTPQEFWKY